MHAGFGGRLHGKGPQPRIPGHGTSPCSPPCTRAVNALDGALGLARPGATRILVIVSDGRYKGTQHADGQKLITRLVASGCLVIWIAPSDTANTMTGARVVILADPAAVSAAVARAVAASARTA